MRHKTLKIVWKVCVVADINSEAIAGMTTVSVSIMYLRTCTTVIEQIETG